MLIVIICACIVGGMWWRTENRIKKLGHIVKRIEELDLDFLNKQTKRVENIIKDLVRYDENLDGKIVLLAKDMIEMQTTVSNLKPKSKKK